MNVNQQKKYGRIETHTTPITRYATCPVCGYRAQLPRHGRNALACAARVRGMIMTQPMPRK